MKKTIAFLITTLAFVSGLVAQPTLTRTSKTPTVDGVFGESEYQSVGTYKGMKIGATLGSDDMLYIAVEAPTSGWVGFGVGGLVMNGSRLFLGAVQNGKPAIIEKTGRGHFYTNATELVLKKWAVKTVGGDTVLELSIPLSAALWKGRVNSIFAYSKSSDFTVQHAMKGSITFTIP